MSIRVDGIFYVLDAISDNILQGLLAECRDRFFICSRHKNRTAEIEQMQEDYAKRIQACKEEITRRESLRMKRAA
jgi:hypothetical protein